MSLVFLDDLTPAQQSYGFETAEPLEAVEAQDGLLEATQTAGEPTAAVSGLRDGGGSCGHGNCSE